MYAIQAELLLYESKNNHYPVSLVQAAQEDPAIAKTLARLQKDAIQYTYQSNGAAYSFCIVLPQSLPHCVHGGSQTPPPTGRAAPR